MSTGAGEGGGGILRQGGIERQGKHGGGRRGVNIEAGGSIRLCVGGGGGGGVQEGLWKAQ